MGEDILTYLGIGRIEGLITDFERLVERVTDGTSRSRKAFEEVGETVTKTARDSRKTVEQELEAVLRVWDRTHDRIDRSHLAALQRMNRAFAGWQKGTRVGLKGMRKEWDKFWDDSSKIVDTHTKKATGALGKLGDAMGMSGTRGLASGIGVQVARLTSVLGPFGGILGLALYGKRKEEDWRARAHQVMRQFEAIGGTAHEMTRSVIGDIQQLEYMWNSMGQELQASAGAMVEAGFSYEEAVGRVDTETSRLRQNVLGLTTELDVMGAAAAGTSAKVASQVAATTGDSLSIVADQLARVATSARNTGQSYTFLVNTLSQATMQLRLQRQGLEDVMPLYQRLQAGAERVFGGNKAFSAQRAAGQVQAVAQGLTSDRLGFHSLLFQQMGGLGAGMDPLEFETALAEGNIGGLEGGALLDRYVGLVQRFLEDRTPGKSREHRIGFLMRAAGMGREEATGLVDIAARGAGGGAMDEDTQRLLERAMGSRGAEMSKYERLMLKLQQDLARIGLSIVKILMGMAASIAGGISALVGYFKDDEVMQATGMAASMAGYAAMGRGFSEAIEIGASMAQYSGKTLFGPEFTQLSSMLEGRGVYQKPTPEEVESGQRGYMQRQSRAIAGAAVGRARFGRGVPEGARKAVAAAFRSRLAASALAGTQSKYNLYKDEYEGLEPYEFQKMTDERLRKQMEDAAGGHRVRQGGQTYMISQDGDEWVISIANRGKNPRGSPR